MYILKKINYILNRHQKIELLWMAVLITMGSALELAGVSIILPVMNSIMSPDSLLDNKYAAWVYNFFGMINSRQFVFFLLIVMIFIYVFKNAYLIFMYNRQYRFVYKNLHILSDQMMNCYLHQTYLFHVSKTSSELLRNINVDAANFYGVIQSCIQLITELAVCFVLVIYLFIQDRSITIAILVLMAILLICFMKIYRKALSGLGQESRFYYVAVNKWIQQGFGGIKEIKVLNKEDFFYDQFDKAYGGHANVECRYHSLMAVPKPAIEVICIVGMLGTIAIKIMRGTDLTYFIPIMSMFVVAAFRMLPSFNRITEYLGNIMYQKASVDAVYNDLKEIEKLNAQHIEKSHGETVVFNKAIHINNVSFAYPNNDREVLSDLSLDITKNTSVAFIGQSGAGKTTLADIILGILEPSEGNVLSDDKDIFKNLESWHSKIGYIPQTIYLLDDTIARNITFGIQDKDVDDRKLNYALERAQLRGMIEELADGINTEIGEGGIRLSGGQRQRIGIARALYNEPEILILDEATSALDNDTEEAVMEAIDSLHGEMTLVIIAHRLSTIKNCDFVYEVKDGKAIERK